jgi:hypothetical protein
VGERTEPTTIVYYEIFELYCANTTIFAIIILRVAPSSLGTHGSDLGARNIERGRRTNVCSRMLKVNDGDRCASDDRIWR